MLLPEKQKKAGPSGKNGTLPKAEKKGLWKGHLWGQTLTPRHAFGIAPGAAHDTLEERPLPAAPVLQAAGHIAIEKDMPGIAGGPLPESDRPTIIFESMGKDLKTCKAVYDESRRYPGNTICVFGLNMRREAPRGLREAPDDFDKDAGYLESCAGELARGMDDTFLTAAENERTGRAGEGLEAWRQNRRRAQPAPDPAQPFHLLYTFSFTWKKPVAVKESDAYLLPFVEARKEVMQKAAAVREKFRGAGNQYYFLYRWIDGDATDDTTIQIDADRLNEWAQDDTAQVITGRYDWRHMDPRTERAMPKYHEFLKRLNDSERRLRDYYHELARQSDSDESRKGAVEKILMLQGRHGYGDTERAEIEVIKKRYFYDLMPLERKLDQNGYLPGYYFPETALMMNEAAHGRMKKEQDVGEGMQDKESMRIVKRAAGVLTDVSYVSELTVKKPLKHEFESGTYLGADLLAFFMGNDNGEGTFDTALKNVRQSAFNLRMWYFSSNSDPDGSNDKRNNQIRQGLLDEERKQEVKKLWDYLQGADGQGTVLGTIRSEFTHRQDR